MKKLKKYWFSTLALVLTMVVGAYYALSCFFSVNREEVNASVRTVQLSDTEMDYQAILNEFEDSELTTEGSLTTFKGYQTLDSSLFEGIDNVSESDVEALHECNVGYKFTYDYESNVVTLYAQMQNELGELEIDTLSGVGFINDNGEIDAVMNVEGEGILLSEMRNAGIIQNCGWFSKMVKKVAQNVINVAVAVVAATAAVAATAVVIAGVGTATVATAATIGTCALATAAVAAGVMLTVDIFESSYPGIKIEKKDNVLYAKWNEKTKKAIKDIVTQEKNKKDPAIYFHVIRYNNANGPVQIDLSNRYTKGQMAEKMQDLGWSSLTQYMIDAYAVIQAAFLGYSIVCETHGLSHYHAKHSNGAHVTAGENDYTIHSFFII